jgi:hypothetical protein
MKKTSRTLLALLLGLLVTAGMLAAKASTVPITET